METNGRAPRETPSNPERHQPRRLLKLWEPVRTALMAALAACDLADMHQHPALKVVRGWSWLGTLRHGFGRLAASCPTMGPPQGGPIGLPDHCKAYRCCASQDRGGGQLSGRTLLRHVVSRRPHLVLVAWWPGVRRLTSRRSPATTSRAADCRPRRSPPSSCAADSPASSRSQKS